jgi:hypothetical protein
MVTAGWWPGAPQQQRRHAIAGRMLALPDGTWWLFGAWARWYRWHPSDGQWYLCPPPQSPGTRASARPVRPGAPVPGLPPHVLPAGPDFAYDGPAPLPFVGQELSPELSSRVRATVESAAALPAEDYPHWWALFPSSMPSTVPATWGVMLWCAAAPVFDSRLDEQMLGLWTPYRAKPLPQLDGPRWLTPPPLEALIGLYAERLRSGRVDAAVVVLRTLWSAASALRGDPRFQARADALLAILGATLNNPTLDYGALPYGDQALVQQWLTRCPPQLAPALRNESSPGDNFRHAFYELAQAVAPVCGDPAEPAYMEPRLVAAALIAADLAVIRQDVASMVVPWLDPEIRYTVQAVLSQSGHPLRGLWPKDNRLPDVLRSHLGGSGDDRSRDVLLASMYAADLAWCRLGGGIPARPRGFPVPTAAVAEIIGVERAKAAASAQPITPPPGVAPMAQEDPGGARPGGPYPAVPQSLGAEPAVSGQPGSTWPGQDQIAPAASAEPAPEQPPVPGPPPAIATTPDVPEPADAGERPGTRIMSETMVGDMLDAPMPEQPVDEIKPPLETPALPIIERFGVSFVCGPEETADAGRLLDELSAWTGGPRTGPAAADDPDATTVDKGPDATTVDKPDAATMAPSVLLVGAPHTGQRRLARMIARALGGAGAGSESLRTADSDDVRAAPAELIMTVLAAEPSAGSAAILFERLDVAIMEAIDPASVAEAVRRTRRETSGGPAVIATCEPRAYRRLAADYAELIAVFRVFRLPDLTEPDGRLTLLHVLADERRVTINSAALDAVRDDLDRLRGPGELVNARLVETYLERACQRRVGRAGASRDRLILTPEDFAGVAAEIEPSLRQPTDVDGYLRELDDLIGLDGVKAAIEGVVEEARMAGLGAPLRHLIFLGPPGVGKATVAGLLGGIYAALGVLDSGHLVACRPVHLAGKDAIDTEIRVSAMVEQAMGGVLLIEQAERLARSPDVVTELLKHMMAARGEFLVVGTSGLGAMTSLLTAHSDFQAEFADPVEFAPLTDRQLVRVFQKFAERDLYLLDEELRVELLARFGRMREEPDFSYAITVRRLFEETVERQASRLAGGNVTATSVARLTARDLPESGLEQMMGDFRQDPDGR